MDDKSNNSNNKKKKIIIMILIIMAIIILLLLVVSFVLKEGTIQFNNDIPNDNDINNVEVIDESDITAKSAITNGIWYIGKTINTEEVIKEIYAIISENKGWKKTEDINIFRNEYYGNTVIAPGAEGEYKFKVNNGFDCNMMYILQLKEVNPDNINIKYKIRNEDKYLIEQWTSIKDISLPRFEINSQTVTVYTIEWKWEDSSNDTEIGLKGDDVEYRFKITSASESKEE